MNILSDMHHDDLFYSLYLLFEKRLGHKLYRQIGLEWYEAGYWNVFPHPDTAKQFLGTNQGNEHPKDIHGNLLPDSACLNRNFTIENGIYYITNPTKHHHIQRAITLDKFKDMKFDIIISSIPQHIQPFNDLINRFQPRAKHIFQVGNAWGRLPGVNNLLASTTPFDTTGLNSCFYHQEFDLDMFKYEPPTNNYTINSYIHWMQRKDLMNQYAQALPGYIWKSYGAGMEDTLQQTKQVAEAMNNSAFSWHYKPEGDGYGYSTICSYACGRPQIIWGSFYNNKLASKLMEHGKTCIDISINSFEENIRLIKHFSQPEEHNKMCENAYQRFRDTVNFDEDEQKVRKFIERLI